MKTNSPYFLWDYNLDENQIRTILQADNDTEKKWLIGRILTHARFEDVWKYLTIKDILNIFPRLQLSPKTKQAWQRALSVWGYHVQTTQ